MIDERYKNKKISVEIEKDRKISLKLINIELDIYINWAIGLEQSSDQNFINNNVSRNT